jgi:hypothetical protein
MKNRMIFLGATTLIATPALARQMATNEGAEHMVVYATLPDSDIAFHPKRPSGFGQSFSADQVTAPYRPRRRMRWGDTGGGRHITNRYTGQRTRTPA